MSKTILITGATSGIGFHTALALVKQGHRVIATGRRQHALQALQDQAKSELLHVHPLDVTDNASIRTLRAYILELTDGAGVDILINNAGYGHLGPIALISDENLRRQFDTNVFGLMAVTRAFLPEMQRRRSGRIVNIGSIGGRITFPFGGAYHASKYALEALSDALRIELAPFGIRTSVIEPGPIRTEFGDVAVGMVDQYRDSEYAAIVAKADKMQAQADSMAAPPEVVVRAIEHASFSRWSRARYVVPKHMYPVLAFFQWLPTGIVDGVLRMMVGLSQQNVGTARPAILEPATRS
jgi:NAD(P)-dependent dehydrogenase (short-subunit alcohol dehydrogenase family)